VSESDYDKIYNIKNFNKKELIEVNTSNAYKNDESTVYILIEG